MSVGPRHENEKTREDFLLSVALRSLAKDAIHRSRTVCRRVGASPIWLLTLAPQVSASSDPLQYPANTTDPKTESDVESLVGMFSWREWSAQADAIRNGANRRQCLANLSITLAAFGPLVQTETSGSSGALTLLPTAGALIGAPTKELWVVYKLMPIAGVLSMLLSLGGNIVPTDASDYELNSAALSYGGMIATHTDDQEAEEMEEHHSSLFGAQAFAAKVEARSRDMRGGTKYIRVWYGIIMQCLWLGVLLSTCWFTQSGSIIVWWCKSWGWMFFWYLMLASASILENFASVPFTRQWTLRVSRAPRVRISDDAPLVRQTSRVSSVPSTVQDTIVGEGTKSANGTTFRAYEDIPLVQRTSSSRSTEVLDALESGFNCKGQVVRDDTEPWSSSRVPFYVIISLEGVSGSHAVLRVISKAISVGVYAAGTAMFASAQLITISVALTILCLILGAGVFGRVVAMWMASEMMKTKPVLHRVVKSRGLAAEHIDHILSIDGLIVEVMGHVIVNGRCIARYNNWTRLSNWLGILAGPYDIGKLAIRTGL